MLDLERESRRPGWRRGRAIVTPDGGRWWLPPLRPEHVGRLPRLGRYLRDVRDGESFLSVTGDRPEDFEEITSFMVGLAEEALLLQYDVAIADLARVMDSETPVLRSRRLVDVVREVVAAARDAGLSRYLLLEPMGVA